MFRTLIISLILVAGVCEADKMCETLQSAFTVDDVTYFITDQRVVLMRHDSEIDDDAGIPVRIPGQMAAASLPSMDQYVLISCSQSVVYSNEGVPLGVSHNHQDIDYSQVTAATAIGDDMFLFSGSQYQTYNYKTGALSDPQDMGGLNLPSDVDAAFHDPFLAATVVVKANEIYVADDSDSTHAFYGPLPLDLFFDLESLNLCSEDHYFPH